MRGYNIHFWAELTKIVSLLSRADEIKKRMGKNEKEIITDFREKKKESQWLIHNLDYLRALK